MHDINRDDIFKKTSSGQKVKKSSHSHGSGEEHSHGHEGHNHHEHNDEHDRHDEHNHNDEESFTGHDHNHDTLDEHFHSDHSHKESRFESRAYHHVHEHSHKVHHAHHHEHSSDENTLVHRIFNNPLQDWFALIFMSVLLLINQTVPMNDNLDEGFLIVITVMGLFPLLKNAIFEGILKKKILPELLAAIFLFGLIFAGEALTAAIMTIFIFLGSFLKLDFSWK